MSLPFDIPSVVGQKATGDITGKTTDKIINKLTSLITKGKCSGKLVSYEYLTDIDICVEKPFLKYKTDVVSKYQLDIPTNYRRGTSKIEFPPELELLSSSPIRTLEGIVLKDKQLVTVSHKLNEGKPCSYSLEFNNPKELQKYGNPSAKFNALLNYPITDINQIKDNIIEIEPDLTDKNRKIILIHKKINDPIQLSINIPIDGESDDLKLRYGPYFLNDDMKTILEKPIGIPAEVISRRNISAVCNNPKIETSNSIHTKFKAYDLETAIEIVRDARK